MLQYLTCRFFIAFVCVITSVQFAVDDLHRYRRELPEHVIKMIVFLLNRFTQERGGDLSATNEEDHQEESRRNPLAPIKAKY